MKKQAAQKQVLTGSWQHLSLSIKLIRQYLEPIIFIALLPALTLQLGIFLGPKFGSLGQIVYFIGALWLLVSVPALVRLELRAVRHESVNTAELYRQGLKFLLRIIGVGILTSLLIFFGCLLFIIPGLICMRRYALAPYYVVDKNMGILAAMKQSAADSKPASGYIWGSIGVLFVVNIFSALAGLTFSFMPGVPVIVTSLISLGGIFLLAFRYVEITQKHPATSSSS